MGYYQGDYYRGDYYRGDPGFWGAIGGAIKGAAGGLLTGNPLKVIGGAVSGAITGARGGTSVTPYEPPMIIKPIQIETPSGNYLNTPSGGGIDVPKGMGVPTPGIGGAISRFLPGGMSGYSGAPAGYHYNKAYVSYLRGTAMGKHLKDPTKAARVVSPVVKNRRMNPLNARALRHAIRRQRNMVSLMRHVLAGSGFTIGKRGFGGKKTRRRR